MRFSFAIALFVSSVQTVSAFAPVPPTRWTIPSSSTVRSTMEAEDITVSDAVELSLSQAMQEEIVPLTEAEINARLSIQMEKLQAKDSTSTKLSKEVSRIHVYIHIH
jgi:antitoxin component of RelBE/YafQ-DinJ toxin-antitoxin module